MLLHLFENLLCNLFQAVHLGRNFLSLDAVVGFSDAPDHLAALPDGSGKLGIAREGLLLLLALLFLLALLLVALALLLLLAALSLALHIQVLLVDLVAQHQAGLLVVDVRVGQDALLNHLLQILEHKGVVESTLPHQHIDGTKLAAAYNF